MIAILVGGGAFFIGTIFGILLAAKVEHDDADPHEELGI